MRYGINKIGFFFVLIGIAFASPAFAITATLNPNHSGVPAYDLSSPISISAGDYVYLNCSSGSGTSTIFDFAHDSGGSTWFFNTSNPWVSFGSGVYRGGDSYTTGLSDVSWLGTFSDTYASILAACGSTADVYVSSSTSPTPPAPTIELTTPVNGSTSRDFGTWIATTTNLNECAYTMTVTYGMSTSSMTYSDSNSGSLCVESYPTVPKTNPLWFPPLLTPTWYAQAHIVSGTSTATSSIISFTIDPNYGAGTPSSTVPAAECSGSSSDFSYWICRAFSYLFSPPDNVFEPYYSLGDSIKYKPPFGYFVLVSEQISSSTIATTTGELLNASTSSAFSDIFSPVYTGFSWLLWSSLGFYILKRFIHFEL